ncbi:MAG: hypothetical protein J2P31_13975 [Blastocatellia bacterium]|nr:hypothetical protein [Blastocatellia bacterium]
MRRLLAGSSLNWKGMLKTLHDFTSTGRTRDQLSVAGELTVILPLPDADEGKTVPASAVIREILWQLYGLDLPHPEFNRWLERNAPDVKYAIARYQSTCDEDCVNEFKVGSDGTIKVQLSIEIDQRLREVTSQYMRWQVQEPDEPYRETFVEHKGDMINSHLLP